MKALGNRGFEAAIEFLKWIGIHTDFKQTQLKGIYYKNPEN